VQKWPLYHQDSGSEGGVTERGGTALPQASHDWCDLANAVRRRKGVISCCGSPVRARFQLFGCCERQTALRRRSWVQWPLMGSVWGAGMAGVV
jgi:hypothetical protein